jgi:hypothetical protein
LFLPAVRVFAPIFILTAVSIGLDKMFSLPLGALIFLVIVNMGLSSKVLPVVSIHTGISSVRGIAIRAPYSLEMKHVKVSILFKFIKEINRNFFFMVSKSAHVAVVTTFNSVWIRRTKLDLVFFWMIEFLNPIVRPGAAVSHWAVKMGLCI